MLYINSYTQLNTSVIGGDKSISHRALMIAAVATSPSVIRNVSLCSDVLTTAKCLRTLGAKVDFCGDVVTVQPIDRRYLPNDVVLDCENSGTTARLLCGLVCGLGVRATFVGDDSLTRRPMDRVTKPLCQMGAKFTFPKGALFQTLGGQLVGRQILSTVNSAQVKSAVLLAGLFAEGTTQYVEKVATRDHTERMLAYVGAKVDGCCVQQSTFDGFDLTVPVDVSSAAYVVSAALVTKQSVTVPNVDINSGRIGFFNVLKRANVPVEFVNKRVVCGEGVADIVVSSMDLPVADFVADSQDVCDGIDEMPLLATVAIALGVNCRLDGIAELAVKESNRIAAVVDMVQKCGQTAFVQGDCLIVRSNGILPKHPVFDDTADHRIVMCQALLCVAVGGGTVQNYSCVDVSFPNFWQALGVNFKRFAVAGSDISYSRSPALMQGFAQQNDFCMSYDIVSLPRDVSDKQLLDTIDRYDGCNVTIPFKQRVAQLTNADLPSVNTVGKNIKPTSTDGVGFLRALDKHGFVYKNVPLWVIGAGGAAEACIAQLIARGAKVRVFNRTSEHLHKLASKYQLCQQVDNPVGVVSFVPPCPFEDTIDLPPSVQYVFVASYTGDSPLLAKAQKHGISCCDGSDMLYFQGEESFQLWQGK